MRLSLTAVTLVVSLFAILPTQAQGDDPVARSRAGEVECYAPDRVARTCRAISTYRAVEGGRIINDAIVFLQNDPRILMYVSSNVVVRADVICGRVERRDLDAARFDIDGVRASAAEAQTIREAIAESFLRMGEICSRYEQDGDTIAVTVTADGVERPDLADRMIWIRREDGYTVGAVDAAPT